MPASDGTIPERKLTAKEVAFVEHYLVHQNGSLAARQAGYSEKNAYQTAYENLRKPHISSRVRERLREIQMLADEVHERLSDHARVDMTDFLTVRDEVPPLWSPEAKYRRTDMVSWGDKCYRAIADNRAVDPDDDEGGIYWERAEPRKFVDLDLPAALAAGKGHLIQKAGYNKHGQLEIELVNSQTALIQVGRIHKMFTDKTEMTGKDGKPLISDAEAIAEAALKRLRGDA